MVEDGPKFFGVTEVNERQTLSVREHDVVGLSVTMSDTLNRVKVEDSIEYLATNIPLQFNGSATFHSGLGVMVDYPHQEI